MKILIVGYSRFVRNRVMPVLMNHPEISAIDIASRSNAGRVSRCLPVHEVFTDYGMAFSKSAADIVYVSTVNSSHTDLVKAALSAGKHVIVDKPSFTELSGAREVLDRARRSGLCIAEATIYAYHRQVNAIKDQFDAAGCAPSRLIAVFSVPPLNADNFRYEAKLGGGAMFDLGPYAVSVGRVFFGREEPVEIEARITGRGGKDAVDISFSMLATYPGGKSMVGHFGFDTEYQNHLEVIGPGVSVKADRIFTTPADMENKLHVQLNNASSTVSVAPCDNFRIFFDSVIDAVKRGDHASFAADLLIDAQAIHRLRASASEAHKCR